MGGIKLVYLTFSKGQLRKSSKQTKALLTTNTLWKILGWLS